MSTVALDKIAELDKDYVTIVRQCARECAVYERELWIQQEAESEKLVRDYSCTVATLSDEQMEELRQAVQPMYDTCSEEEQDLILQIRDS